MGDTTCVVKYPHTLAKFYAVSMKVQLNLALSALLLVVLSRAHSNVNRRRLGISQAICSFLSFLGGSLRAETVSFCAFTTETWCETIHFVWSVACRGFVGGDCLPIPQ